MGLLARRLFLLLLVVTYATAQAKIDSKQFVGWLNEYYKQNTPLAGETRNRAAQFRYVFVNGFLNEVQKKTSFRDMTLTLTRQGVSKNSIHVLRPSSINSIAGNLDWLQLELKKLADLGPEKLVLIGHSKGAAETLAVALQAPAWLQDKIHAIYLVQGAMHGSPIADFFMNEGVTIDSRLPLAVRYVLKQIQSADLPTKLKNAETWLGFSVDEGLLSLTKRATQAFWKTHLADHRGSIAAIGSKTFYLRSAQAPSKVRWMFMAPGYYQDVYYGPNDGVLPRAHQSLREIGTPLADLTMDHVDLVSEDPKTPAALRLREAVMKAILSGVAAEAS